MANEIWHSYDEAGTLYALIWRKTDDKVYDAVAGSDTFDTYTDADIGDYDVPLANHADSDYHSVDFPSDITVGIYRVVIMFQVSGSPHADDDTAIAQGEIVWSGSAEIYGFETDGGLTAAAILDLNTVSGDRFVHHHTVVKEAKTDVTIRVLLKDLSGDPKTSQTITDLDLYYIRVETDNDVTISAKADLTALASLTAVHADNKGYEIGQGYYRIDVPDAAFATGAYRGLSLLRMELVLLRFCPLWSILSLSTISNFNRVQTK